MNLEYAMGLVFGLAVGFGVVALLFKKKVLDMTFDERQELARGKAYRYGFQAMGVSVILYGILDETVGEWCDTLTGNLICFCIGLTVFAVTCILNDAYMSLKENPRKVMTLCLLVALMNLASGWANAAHGTVIVDGKLSTGATNLIVGGMSLLLLAVYIINYALRERETE